MTGQRTVNVVALAVRGGGPSAKRLGLLDAFGPENGREYDTRQQQIGYVEAGADGGAVVERAAAAAAFDVRRYAHGAIGEQSAIAIDELSRCATVTVPGWSDGTQEWVIKRETL